MKKLRVAVNGYGVIGKRVADAVKAQQDMELVGVADVETDYRIKTATVLGIAVYAAVSENISDMRNAGIPVEGTLRELLSHVDVVADCTPKKIGAANKPLYEQAGVKVIYQGGEKHELTGHSFVAQANYESAVGRHSTRVVSCARQGRAPSWKKARTAILALRFWTSLIWRWPLRLRYTSRPPAQPSSIPIFALPSNRAIPATTSSLAWSMPLPTII